MQPLPYGTVPTLVTRAMAKPSYIAYVVRSRKGQKDYWNKIGALMPHKGGKGIALGLDGKLVLRLPKANPKT
jgi:hypothetical protein